MMSGLELQRSRSVMLSEFGDMYVAQGNLGAALDSYRASFAIRERLAKADPGNADWQRDRALSLGRIATVEGRLGERRRALGAFEEGREIINRLRASSPCQWGDILDGQCSATTFIGLPRRTVGYAGLQGFVECCEHRRVASRIVDGGEGRVEPAERTDARGHLVTDARCFFSVAD
jgi:hypothetical protein